MRSLLGVFVVAAILGCEMPDEAADIPRPPEDLGPATAVKSEPKGPQTYQVALDTTKGRIVIEVDRELAPRGADRFYRLVKEGFYDDAKFFRVIEGFMAQFGMAADPELTAKWREKPIRDDPVKASNTKGMVTFAKTGLPNSRSTQVFINFGDNQRLDADGFAPFGKVVDGLDVALSLYSGYGEGAPQGNGPSQGRITAEGNAYLEKEFPKLDGIKSATIIKENGKPVGKEPATSEEKPAAPPEEPME